MKKQGYVKGKPVISWKLLYEIASGYRFLSSRR